MRLEQQVQQLQSELVYTQGALAAAHDEGRRFADCLDATERSRQALEADAHALRIRSSDQERRAVGAAEELERLQQRLDSLLAERDAWGTTKEVGSFAFSWTLHQSIFNYQNPPCSSHIWDLEGDLRATGQCVQDA